MFDHLPGRVPAATYIDTQTTPLLDQERARRAAEAEAQRVSDATTVWDGIGSAAAQGTVGLLDRHAEEMGFKTDPAFRLPENFAEDMKARGLREEQWPLFERAQSAEHYEWLSSIAAQNQVSQDDLSQFGVLGNIGLAALDPGMVALDIVAAPIAVSAQAGRAANAVRSGIAGAALNAGASAAIGEYDPTVTRGQIALDAALGFTFGSGAGWLQPTEVAQLNDAARRLTSAKLAVDDDVDDSLSAARVEGFVSSDLTLTPIKEGGSKETARLGAAMLEKDVRPAFANVRRDLAARLGKSQSPLVRHVGRKLMRDGVGYTDRTVAVEEAASEYAKRLDAVTMTEFRRAIEPAWTKYRKANRIAAWDASARNAFMDKLGRAVRGDSTIEPEIAGLAPHVQRAYARNLDELKAAGVQGFEDVDANANYVQRAFSKDGYRRVFGELGLDEDTVIDGLLVPAMRTKWETNIGAERQRRIETNTPQIAQLDKDMVDAKANITALKLERVKTERMLDEAIREEKLTGDPSFVKAAKDKRNALRKQINAAIREQKARKSTKAGLEKAMNLTLSEPKLRAVAKAWLKRGQAHLEGGDSRLTRGLPTDEVEEIERMLREAGADPNDVEEIIGGLTLRNVERSTHARAKHRIDMDETFRAKLVNPATGQEHEVSIMDLLDNNVDRLVTSYSREMAGWAALSRKLDVKSRADFERLREQFVTEARNAGDDADELARVFDLSTKSILGQSTEANPGSFGSRMGRMARDYNFVRVMGQVGYTMFAEIGPTLAYAGFRNTLRAVTEGRSLFRKAQSGELEEDTARMLDRIIAPGTDFVRSPPFLREDELGATYGDGVWNKADNTMQVLKRTQSILSGMAPIHTAMQRIAARASLDRLVQLARKAELSPAEIRRLRNWGMSEQMQGRVFERLRASERIEDLDPSSWDFNTREAFSAFLWRVTRHQVVEGDVSDSLEFMHSAFGKVFVQFRTFMNTAYTRHMLNGLHHIDDWRTWAMMTTSTFFAALGWTGRTYINTIGEPEKRERTLTPENIAKAGFQQSSFSSVMPVIWDTFANAVNTGLGEDVLGRFNFRSTDLATGAVMGNPTVDALMKASRAGLTAVPKLLGGEDLTREDAEAIGRLVIFNNLTGVRNVADAIYAEFPREPR